MRLEISDCRFVDLILLLSPFRRRFRVSGLSMSPVLQDGDEVIVKINDRSLSSVRVNDVVVLYHPDRHNLIMIKRIKDICLKKTTVVTPSKSPKTIEQATMKARQYFVQGDNLSASTDSRHFGWVDENLIIGKVVCRFL